jgi:hypothetical protein
MSFEEVVWERLQSGDEGCERLRTEYVDVCESRRYAREWRVGRKSQAELLDEPGD